MTLAEKIKRIAIAKEAIVDKYHNLLGGWAKDMEKQMVRAIGDALTSLDVVGGVIVNNERNIEQLAYIERALREVNERHYPRLAVIIENGTSVLNAENMEYFRSVYNGSTAILDNALIRAGSLMRAKVGITEAGALIRNGWMASVVEDTTILRGIKDILLKAVISASSMKLARNAIVEYIIGKEDRIGVFERYVKQTVYDIFQQHDAAYSANIAEELNFNHFVYTGGLIGTSRDFCREHDGRVYHKDETKEWPSWTPAKAVHITEFKQKDLYAIPSYINYTGYNPIIDRGGYNCRHFLSWIADDTAKRLIEENNKMLQQKTDK